MSFAAGERRRVALGSALSVQRKVAKLLRFRPFLNTDPPRLSEIWRSVGARPGFAQPMSAAVLDQFVFGKPYFDRNGLIVAEEMDADGVSQVVGFVHACFGADASGDELDREIGATLMLLVRDGDWTSPVAAALLQQSEEYLRREGAKVIYGGGVHPLSTFYVGLYGGGELPGVLDSDADWQRLFGENGYRGIDRTCVYSRTLRGFRPAVDRKAIQLRRTATLTGSIDPPLDSRIEAFSTCGLERMAFHAARRGDGAVVAEAAFRDLGPFAANWGAHGIALTHLEVAPECRRQGWATYLLGETLTRLSEHGFSVIHATTMERNEAACALYEKFGFERVDAGTVFRKEGTSSPTDSLVATNDEV